MKLLLLFTIGVATIGGANGYIVGPPDFGRQQLIGSLNNARLLLSTHKQRLQGGMDLPLVLEDKGWIFLERIPSIIWALKSVLCPQGHHCPAIFSGRHMVTTMALVLMSRQRKSKIVQYQRADDPHVSADEVDSAIDIVNILLVAAHQISDDRFVQAFQPDVLDTVAFHFMAQLLPQ